jgi:hypothetical protein
MEWFVYLPSKILLLKGGAGRQVVGYGITELWDFNSLQKRAVLYLATVRPGQEIPAWKPQIF